MSPNETKRTATVKSKHKTTELTHTENADLAYAFKLAGEVALVYPMATVTMTIHPEEEQK